MGSFATRQVVLLPFPFSDPDAVILEAADFPAGSLQFTSYARPGKLRLPEAEQRMEEVMA